MSSEHKWHDYLEQEEWFSLFELVKNKPDATRKDALSLPIFNKRVPKRAPSTVGRALNVALWLVQRDDNTLTQDDIKQYLKHAGYGTTLHYVEEANRRFIEWKTGSKIPLKRSLVDYLERLHLDNILSQLETLRSCLEYPTLNDLPDYRTLLNVRGNDWRLDPVMWFYLSTPDFSNKDLWGPKFPMLESHMKESPFWEHLEHLEHMVKDLEKYYDIIALKLSAEDQRFRDFWRAIQVERLRRETAWGYKPSRTTHSPEPTPEDFKLYYDQEYAKEVTKRFERIDDGLSLRQFELEKMLDQLNNDLLPDLINPIIVRGHCEKCP
jgi:hypothetical protein